MHLSKCMRTLNSCVYKTTDVCVWCVLLEKWFMCVPWHNLLRCAREYFSLVVCIASVTCCILLYSRVTCWTPTDFYWECIFHQHNYHLLVLPSPSICPILSYIFFPFLFLFRTSLLAWHHSSLLNMAAWIRYLPRSNKFDVDCDTHFNNTLTLTLTHTHFKLSHRHCKWDCRCVRKNEADRMKQAEFLSKV